MGLGATVDNSSGGATTVDNSSGNVKPRVGLNPHEQQAPAANVEVPATKKQKLASGLCVKMPALLTPNAGRRLHQYFLGLKHV